MALALPDTLLAQVSESVAAQMGLSFPRRRWPDLARGIERSAAELGFADAAACGAALAATALSPRQVEVLADHLTVGETYFFRERKSFDAFEQHLLPELIRARRGSEQRLRIWSAGCCTGEEAYSIAILVRKQLWDWRDWQITILATDLAPRNLRKASAGVYGKWSFRGAAWARELYFRPAVRGRFEVLPDIRRMVTFARLNLAADVYPSVETNTAAMDVIFCRNVLMYFAPGVMDRVLQSFRRSLPAGGWLIVSPTEVSAALNAHFSPVRFEEATLYRAGGPATTPPIVVGQAEPPPQPARLPLKPERAPAPAHQPATKPPATEARQLGAYELALAAYEQGDYATAAAHGAEALVQGPGEARVMVLLARIGADEGKLAQALAWCERAIAANRLDPVAYYLLAVIQQELGREADAQTSLRRTLYLQPDFVLAHIALGNVMLRQGKRTNATRHFDHAAALLDHYRQDESPPEAGGLTAGRLRQMIRSATGQEG